YTEKVWGMSCKEISADWAAQRIKGLSLGSAIWHAFFRPKNRDKGKVIKTLIDTFRYPRKGPGMMWEACADRIREMGGTLLMGQSAIGFQQDQNTRIWQVQCRGADGSTRMFSGQHVISSAPIRELVPRISPSPAGEAVKAANSLKYRD